MGLPADSAGACLFPRRAGCCPKRRPVSTGSTSSEVACWRGRRRTTRYCGTRCQRQTEDTRPGSAGPAQDEEVAVEAGEELACRVERGALRQPGVRLPGRHPYGADDEVADKRGDAVGEGVGAERR